MSLNFGAFFNQPKYTKMDFCDAMKNKYYQEPLFSYFGALWYTRQNSPKSYFKGFPCIFHFGVNFGVHFGYAKRQNEKS